jgi:hypothetical protein
MAKLPAKIARIVTIKKRRFAMGNYKEGERMYLSTLT